jgi:hypothetical protein
MRPAEKLCVADCVADCVWLAVPQATEWQCKIRAGLRYKYSLVAEGL